MSNTIYTKQNPYANVAIPYPLSTGYTSGNITISAGGTGSGGTYSAIWNNGVNTAQSLKPNTIHVNGDAVFEGNITWQDRDMREWFESVEARLNILHPNPKLEDEYEELAKLRQQYVELERKLLEQQKIFNILKKQ